MSDEVRTISVQVPVELVEALQSLADEHERTLSGEVRRALRAHVDAAHRAEAAA